MSEDRFRSFFRMSRPAFTALYQIIKHNTVFHNSSRNPQIDPSIQLATALYFFGISGSNTVRSAAQLGIGEGTTQLYIRRIMIALIHLSAQYITWPTPGSVELRHMRAKIEYESQFPGCIGFLDGTDINLLRAPSWHGETYFNRKKKYAINVQGIVDADRRFRYISTGYPASVGDATVFSETEFFQQPNRFFSSPDEYILADKAYRTTRRCMTPYKEPLASRETDGYKEYNVKHSRARVKVEHAFGILKNRWTSLKGLPLIIRKEKDHGKAICWIMSCITLHNFLCDYELDDEWRPDTVQAIEEDATENIGFGEIDSELTTVGERAAGMLWRDEMRLYLYNRR